MNPLKTAVDNYQMSTTSRELLAKSPIVMLVSISGGGKNTIIEELIKTGKYHYVVSHTTRKPRKNRGELEKDGVNYWFVSEEEMLAKLNSGDFIEAKWVHDSYVYGTSIDEIVRAQSTNKTPLLEIEVQGVGEIIKAKPDAKAIFIVPPDYETWVSRFESRGNVSPEEKSRRMHTAKLELENALANEYFTFLINDNLTDAVSEVQKLIDGKAEQPEARQVANELTNKLS